MEIGEAIRAYRLRRDIHQVNFAAKIGISSSLLSHIEHGRSRMSPQQIGALKGAYPDLWETVVQLKMDELRREMGLDEGEPPRKNVHEEDIRAAYEYLRRALEASKEADDGS